MRGAPRTVVLKLNNWRDFTKTLFFLSKGTWLYRGQEDSEWRLQSSLEHELANVQLMSLAYSPFVKNLAAALGINDTKEIDSPSYIVKDINHRQLENVPSHIALIKMVFDKSMEKDVRNVLDQANINSFTIYPDIIGLARSLRYTTK